MSTHRYAHLYPTAAMTASLFRLHDDPYKHAQSHPFNYAMVWAMLHGTPPPGYADASVTHAQQANQPTHAGAGANADGAPAAAPSPPPAVAGSAATSTAAATTTPLHVNGATAPVTPTAVAAAPATVTPAAVTAVAAESAAPAPLATPAEPATRPGSYSRSQLLSLHRASPLPPELEQALHAAPAAIPWLSSCVSAEALQPLLLSSRPHPAEAELRAELRRDAELTGVEEYAHEWWLPSYSDMAKMGLATGGRHGHAGGRGGGRGGGKRGRGGGNRGGGRGGHQNSYNDKSHSNKKAHTHTHPHPAQPEQAVEAAAASDAVAPTAAASSAAAVVIPSPAATTLPTLGAGRKGQKRAHVRTDADAQQQKKQYAQTNISRLFIGPPLPTGAPLVSPSAPLIPKHEFVLPSGSPPVKHEPAPTAATPAAAVAVPSAGVAIPLAASPLPSKESVFQQAAAGGGSSIADEIMRNIQMHKMKVAAAAAGAATQ